VRVYHEPRPCARMGESDTMKLMTREESLSTIEETVHVVVNICLAVTMSL